MCVMYFECMQIWLETRTPIAGSWRVDNSNYQTISSISPPPHTPTRPIPYNPPFLSELAQCLANSWLRNYFIHSQHKASRCIWELEDLESILKRYFFFLLRKFHSFCILLQISCHWILYTNTRCADLMERVRMIWNYCQLVLAPRGVTSELPF